jgi:hypothetical protein
VVAVALTLPVFQLKVPAAAHVADPGSAAVLAAYPRGPGRHR